MNDHVTSCRCPGCVNEVRMEKRIAELEAEVAAPASGLSKRDAEALGVADMTGPQLRMRVLHLEGELCEAMRLGDAMAQDLSTAGAWSIEHEHVEAWRALRGGK